MFFHIYIAPGQGQTTLFGQNPDANRKALSLCPFVASFKKISLKSDFIHNYSCFYTFVLTFLCCQLPINTVLGRLRPNKRLTST